MRAWRTSLTVTAIASAVLLTAGTTVGVAAARPGVSIAISFYSRGNGNW